MQFVWPCLLLEPLHFKKKSYITHPKQNDTDFFILQLLRGVSSLESL